VIRVWVFSCIVSASVALGGCGKDESRSVAQEPVASASQASGLGQTVREAHAPPAAIQPSRNESREGLATVGIAQLPRQAVATLRLIETGGPFPFEKDGVVFGNRERLLPRQPRGYYHEYTVPTPRARDRGARRIVCGGARRQVGECYYSDDHYASFKRIAG
jgi:ribonuclease T1